MARIGNWVDQNVDDNVSSNLNDLVAEIIFKIWTSPYQIMAPLFKYFSNNEFKNILLLTWFILALVTIIIATILNYALDDFSSLEWFIAVIMNSVLLMILNGIIKVPKVNRNSTSEETPAVPESLTVEEEQPEEVEEEEDLSDLFGAEEVDNIVHDLRKPEITVVENNSVDLQDEVSVESMLSNMCESVGSTNTEDENLEATLVELQRQLENADMLDDEDDDDDDFDNNEIYY
jgi:hypothetical protein